MFLQTLYSADLAPADFYMFPKLKSSLKGKQFDSIVDMQANTETILTPLRKKISMDASRSENIGNYVCSVKRELL